MVNFVVARESFFLIKKIKIKKFINISEETKKIYYYYYYKFIIIIIIIIETCIKIVIKQAKRLI
jgi:hypothetical protein